MESFIMQTYTIVLPIILGYVVWLLKNQKKDRDAKQQRNDAFAQSPDD